MSTIAEGVGKPSTSGLRPRSHDQGAERPRTAPAHGSEEPWSSDLSERQQQIALLVGRGSTNREIAREIAISERTVEYHLGRIFSRLDLRHRRDLRDLVQAAVPLRPSSGRSGR